MDIYRDFILYSYLLLHNPPYFSLKFQNLGNIALHLNGIDGLPIFRRLGVMVAMVMVATSLPPDPPLPLSTKGIYFC